MKPREKGWLKDYLEFRKDLLKDLTSDASRKTSHPEHSLYRMIQPTGLMYGQSVGEIGLPHQEHWDEKDKMKILLAEYQGQPLSGMILTMFGSEAIYLHGGTSSKMKEAMSPYLLHWEAIKLCKNAGMKTYNFGGIAPAQDE